MSFEIDVHYKSGIIDHFESEGMAREFGGGLIDIMRVRFDADIESEGLVVEIRHLEAEQPAEDDFDYEADDRGYSCRGLADAWPVLVDAQEAADVEVIYYNGSPVIRRLSGSLVNLAHVNQLIGLYVDDESASTSYLNIACLYRFFAEQEVQKKTDSIGGVPDDSELIETVSKRLGLPASVVNDALEFEMFSQDTVEDEPSVPIVGDDVDGNDDSYY